MAEALEKQYSAGKVRKAQEEYLHMAQEALATSGADQTVVRLIASDSALTRFANSEIHQNTFEREAQVMVNARLGQREGIATTNKLTAAALKETVDQATAIAKISEPNPDLVDFPDGPHKYPLQVEYHEPTAACTPEERASMVIAGLAVNDTEEYKAAGILTTGQVNVVIANSRGIEAVYSTTNARYTVQWTGLDSSGNAECSSRSVGDLDTVGSAVAALATAKRSANPRRDVPAGRYTVVLGPECVATMLNFLTWVGLSGRDYNDGSSFMCGKLGELVTGREITLADDPLDARTMGLPCDMAGMPKQRLTLIENGVARAVAHDEASAMKAGTTSTGHDTGVNWPVPMNMVLSPGNSTKEELIKGVERGIYVSRFHYTNVVDPLATVITGMTRDGTFLIENGELTTGLTNFRFTQSILEALANCTGMSSELVYHGSFWGSGCLVPEAIRVENFNFSGKSEH